MTSPRVLISGASIAGPTLAYWLNAQGWSTTVIERLDALRDDGQNIDVRGAGREVARRMGIEEAIRAASTLVRIPPVPIDLPVLLTSTPARSFSEKTSAIGRPPREGLLSCSPSTSVSISSRSA